MIFDTYELHKATNETVLTIKPWPPMVKEKASLCPSRSSAK